ncbi:unnamed protein product [Pedinophyceae sp. YPF-701]|nr:unnamed protein product [Pedinophyceae sp. YPF-701]
MGRKSGADEAPLTERMRKATREVHSVSDMLVNSRLAVALTSKRLYAEALALFQPVMEEIETLVEACSHSAVKPAASLLPRTRRAAAMRADITFHSGKEPSDTELSEAQKLYINHVRMLARKRPELLLPYVYHLHMAVFSGGQIIRRQVRRRLKLGDDGPGTAAFELPGENVAALKAEYKRAVDSLERTLPSCAARDNMFEEIVAESKRVFELNNHLVRSWKVSWFATALALLQLLPKEALLTAALFFLTTYVMIQRQGWAPKLGVLGM